MNLNRTSWTPADGEAFLAFLIAQKRPSKEAWARKILNTKMPLLALETPKMRTISHEIAQGNFRSYMNLKLFTHYETVALFGVLISQLETFEEIVHYLSIYEDAMENWAHCDLLTLPHLLKYASLYQALAKKYLIDSRIFVRRLGLFIHFLLIRENESYLQNALQALHLLQQEEAYYVIMMGGWLLSECLILYPAVTRDFISQYPLNRKIQNKGIQKCRESRRLTQEEKDDLMQFKL